MNILQQAIPSRHRHLLGWVAQLAEQRTENLAFTPRKTFALSYGREHE